MSIVAEGRTKEHGVVRVEHWPEGLVLWVGGEIAWKQWVPSRAPDTLSVTLQIDAKEVHALLARITSASR